MVKQNDAGGNGTRIGINLPLWVADVGKAGLWAGLSIWLVQQTLFARNNTLSAVAAAVTQNGIAITSVATKMDTSATAMHTYVLADQELKERQMLVLLEVCVQQAESLRVAGGTQRCFDAARGVRTPPK
jgi:hypothetical protein